MGAGGNTAFAFDRVQYQPLETNPSAKRQSRCLETGRKYESTVQVRLNTVTAYLDGKRVAHWTSNLKDLSRDPAWALRDETLLGLGASGTSTIFHSVEVREVFGRGRPTRGSSTSIDDLPWRPVFDGRTTDGLDLFRGNWNMEGSALEGTPDANGALGLQTRTVYGDADLRVRFQVRAIAYLELAVRNTNQGNGMASFNRAELDALGPTPTVTFRCRGGSVDVSAEGQPWPMKTRPPKPAGTFLIYARGDSFRLLSLEVRNAARESQGWRPLFDGRTTSCIADKVQSTWRVREGALEPTAAGVFYFQTREDLPDGETRILYEGRKISYLNIDAQLSNFGKSRGQAQRTQTSALEGRKIEIVIRCRNEHVSISLDGQPLKTELLGRSTPGAIRIQGEADSFRILSVEHRPGF
jgi:membrane protein implicated in regulation of membrane protease activity